MALLGTANLAFWQVFIAMDALTMGYVTTALHWTFVALNLSAAPSVRGGAQAERAAEAEGAPRAPSALHRHVERTL